MLYLANLLVSNCSAHNARVRLICKNFKIADFLQHIIQRQSLSMYHELTRKEKNPLNNKK